MRREPMGRVLAELIRQALEEERRWPRAGAAGIARVLAKPLQSHDITNALAQALTGRG
jgi:hypothetical protein